MSRDKKEANMASPEDVLPKEEDLSLGGTHPKSLESFKQSEQDFLAELEKVMETVSVRNVNRFKESLRNSAKTYLKSQQEELVKNQASGLGEVWNELEMVAAGNLTEFEMRGKALRAMRDQLKEDDVESWFGNFMSSGLLGYGEARDIEWSEFAETCLQRAENPFADVKDIHPEEAVRKLLQEKLEAPIQGELQLGEVLEKSSLIPKDVPEEESLLEKFMLQEESSSSVFNEKAYLPSLAPLKEAQCQQVLLKQLQKHNLREGVSHNFDGIDFGSFRHGLREQREAPSRATRQAYGPSYDRCLFQDVESIENRVRGALHDLADVKKKLADRDGNEQDQENQCAHQGQRSSNPRKRRRQPSAEDGLQEQELRQLAPQGEIHLAPEIALKLKFMASSLTAFELNYFLEMDYEITKNPPTYREPSSMDSAMFQIFSRSLFLVQYKVDLQRPRLQDRVLITQRIELLKDWPGKTLGQFSFFTARAKLLQSSHKPIQPSMPGLDGKTVVKANVSKSLQEADKLEDQDKLQQSRPCFVVITQSKHLEIFVTESRADSPKGLSREVCDRRDKYSVCLYNDTVSGFQYLFLVGGINNEMPVKNLRFRFVLKQEKQGDEIEIVPSLDLKATLPQLVVPRYNCTTFVAKGYLFVAFGSAFKSTIIKTEVPSSESYKLCLEYIKIKDILEPDPSLFNFSTLDIIKKASGSEKKQRQRGSDHPEEFESPLILPDQSCENSFFVYGGWLPQVRASDSHPVFKLKLSFEDGVPTSASLQRLDNPRIPLPKGESRRLFPAQFPQNHKYLNEIGAWVMLDSIGSLHIFKPGSEEKKSGQ